MKAEKNKDNKSFEAEIAETESSKKAKKKHKVNMKSVKSVASKQMGEFKKFAFKGNIIDLAIAVIIGGAFGKIISSFVGDVIMPLIGAAIGNVDLANLQVVLRTAADGTEVTFRYGAFLQTIFEFLIIATAIFITYKVYMKIKKKLERKQIESPPPPSEPEKLTKTEELLTEIKKLLEEQDKSN